MAMKCCLGSPSHHHIVGCNKVLWDIWYYHITIWGLGFQCNQKQGRAFMDLIGEFEKKRIPPSRISTIDISELGLRRHHFAALLELDVTRAREILQAYKEQKGQTLSFTAWFSKCVSDAIKAHKEVNSCLTSNKRAVVTFEDVDLTVIIEKDINGDKSPIPYVLRKTNEKTLLELHQEIRDAKEKAMNEEDFIFERRNPGLVKFFLKMPSFIRRFFWARALSNPLMVKKTMGTVVITSVGMFGRARGWGVADTVFTLSFMLGPVVKKPGVVENQIIIREYLHLTVLFDHNIIDGAPAARFISDLCERVERADGLAEVT